MAMEFVTPKSEDYNFAMSFPLPFGRIKGIIDDEEMSHLF